MDAVHTDAMRATMGLASALLLAACTTGDTAPMPTPSPEVTGFVRECDSAIFGDPNMRNAITIGPLVLVGIPKARLRPHRAFRPRDGRYDAVKVLVVVRGREDITVTVAADDQDAFALLYDPNARATKDGFLFSAGDSRVTFKACPDSLPQYNGGFIAKEPTCASLQVETETSTQSGSLTIGRGACP